MKYVLAGLAIVAAFAALFFRPPGGNFAANPPAGLGSPATVEAASPLAAGQAPASDRKIRSAGEPRLNSGRVTVYVAGEVTKPGVYTLAADSRAQAALARAGGAKPDADLVAVNLAAPLTDGEEIAVPKVGAETPHRRDTLAPRARSAHRPRRRDHRRAPATANPASDSADLPAQSVDLNSADETQLETLPGIGPALASRIVAYREANGPFTSVDELADISGINPGLQDKIATYLVVR